MVYSERIQPPGISGVWQRLPLLKSLAPRGAQIFPSNSWALENSRQGDAPRGAKTTTWSFGWRMATCHGYRGYKPHEPPISMGAPDFIASILHQTTWSCFKIGWNEDFPNAISWHRCGHFWRGRKALLVAGWFFLDLRLGRSTILGLAEPPSRLLNHQPDLWAKKAQVFNSKFLGR